MDDRETRRGFSLGFGLAGLLSAAIMYFAFDTHYFSGPAWRSVLTAVVVGGGSAFVMVSIEKAIFDRRHSRPATMKGDWGCPRCGAAYLPEATTCSDCHVPLVRADRTTA